MAFGLVLRLRMYRQDSKPDRQKRNAILDLKLRLMVRPVVAGIQNHDLEPEPNIKRLSACIGLWLLVSNGLHSLAKLLPVDSLVKFNQRVAVVVKLFKTCLPVKKSCWPQDQSVDDELNHPNLTVKELTPNKWAENCTNLTNF